MKMAIAERADGRLRVDLACGGHGRHGWRATADVREQARRATSCELGRAQCRRDRTESRTGQEQLRAGVRPKMDGARRLINGAWRGGTRRFVSSTGWRGERWEEAELADGPAAGGWQWKPGMGRQTEPFARRRQIRS
ncbi:hypothetical protein L1887_56991 [Cichorium endivia]|nr:hypothetical protein L1887_56991 [Cichorium endivia]